MGITLQNIADHMQVSKATVSRSLRNDPRIPPNTRAKVHATSVQLGYEGRPRNTRYHSGTARTERERKPVAKSAQITVGLLFPATNLDQVQQDTNLVQTMHGIMAETERMGHLLMVNTMQPGERGHLTDHPDQVPTMIRDSACQVVLVRGAMHPADIAFLVDQLPVVSITQQYPDSLLDTVVPDNVDGIRALVSCLIERGHRSLAWVDGPYDASFLEARQSGFIQGCLHNGLTLAKQRFLGKEIYENGSICAAALVDAVNSGTTAMVCGNDFFAWQVITALESHGLRVPEDVSVTGFDATQGPLGGRRVSSIDPRFTEIGCAAVRLAMQRLSHVAAPPCILSVRSQMIAGDTIAPPRR